MNYLILALTILLAIFILKTLRHHVMRQSFRAMVIIAIFLIALFVAASYFNVSSFFTKDSALVRTGAAVKDTIENNLGDKPLLEGEKLKEISESTYKSIKNSELARKLYK